MLKKLNVFLFSFVIIFGVNMPVFSEEIITEDIVLDEQADSELADEVSMDALNNYVVEGSLFERITSLEQEKVVMQLEKERAQLDLELERLNAEKIKLQMELDTLSGRAEQQQQELEAAKAQLEIQTEKLRQQREAINSYDPEEEQEIVEKPQPKKVEANVSKKYKLVNVVGVDNQLQATIEEIATGQNKRIAVGKELDGYVVKSISLNDGIVFEKDGEEESLNIGK
nr:hypothetical protein [Candidatus Enterousia merdequi]